MVVEGGLCGRRSVAAPTGMRRSGGDCLRGHDHGVQDRCYDSRGVTRRGLYDGGGQERDLAARYRTWAQARRFEYPFVGRILDAIAEGYERDAAWEDTEVRVRQRLEP